MTFNIQSYAIGKAASVLEPLTVTENGTYTPEEKVDGFSSVTVNVPTGITPTGTKTITTNGTHDVTNYASANVNVTPTFTPEDNYKVVVNGGLVDQTERTITANGAYATQLNSTCYVNVEASYPDSYEVMVTDNDGKVVEYEFHSSSPYITPRNFSSLYTTNNHKDTLQTALLDCVSQMYQTFCQCTALTDVTFTDRITSIGDRTFQGCSALTTVTFEGTPTSIDSTCFNFCNNLTDIYVPWSEGEVANAPWGATNATIHYNYVPQ